MGSPISGFIAEAVLQRLESLVFQHHRPKYWTHYVEHIFDWFDDNDAATSNLLVVKIRLHKAYVNLFTYDNKASFYRSRHFSQQRLQEMQDAWTARKAEEIQGYVGYNEWMNFFSATKAVYGPPTKDTALLLCADRSSLLTEKSQIIQR
nr:unnamed protein product [Spirometra erinaceieuropaei]